MQIELDTFPMSSVVAVLKDAGFETLNEIDNGGSISVEHDAEYQDDLVISKLSDRQLSVAHTYLQRGDIMHDPELVFQHTGNDWIITMYRQDPRIRRMDKRGLAMDEFVSDWDHRLKEQGYVDANESLPPSHHQMSK